MLSKLLITWEHFIFWFGWFYHFTVVLMYINSCINPFIYAAKYREFQQGVRRLKLKLNQQESEVVVIT